MRETGRRIAAIALAGGVIAAAQLPALASPATGPTISIAAKSKVAPVTGDVFVIYRGAPAFTRARIGGTVTGASAGQVVKLFAKRFPYKSAWRLVAPPITLSGTGTVLYSFVVTPTLATEFRVELFATGTATTPLATSATDTVYVVASGKLLAFHNCNTRPVCHVSFKFEVFVPPSTLRIEAKKPWYPYFGINFSSTAPRWLYLRAGNGRASTPKRVSAGAFTITITYSFRVGNRGFFPGYNFCAKDTESVDGFNLPGHHSCGAKRIRNGNEYLG